MLKFFKSFWKKEKDSNNIPVEAPQVPLGSNNRFYKPLQSTSFEFLLKRAHIQGHEFADEFNLETEADWLNILTPNAIDWEQINDPRGFTIKIGDFQYGISDEFAGLVIFFEGNINFQNAKAIVEELKQNVERFSGYEAKIIEPRE